MDTPIPTLIIFIFGSTFLLVVSWASLRQLKSHGFYRFFAWEGILLLVLLNVDHWFENPLSLPQIISWLCLLISTYLVIQAVRMLHFAGKQDAARADAALFNLEKTTQLIQTGVYRYIRHPLYSSLLFLTWGAFLKSLSLTGVCLSLVVTTFLAMTAKSEEMENMAFFGAAYQEYMEKSKMFIPFVI